MTRYLLLLFIFEILHYSKQNDTKKERHTQSVVEESSKKQKIMKIVAGGVMIGGSIQNINSENNRVITDSYQAEVNNLQPSKIPFPTVGEIRKKAGNTTPSIIDPIKANPEISKGIIEVQEDCVAIKSSIQQLVSNTDENSQPETELQLQTITENVSTTCDRLCAPRGLVDGVCCDLFKFVKANSDADSKQKALRVIKSLYTFFSYIKQYNDFFSGNIQNMPTIKINDCHISYQEFFGSNLQKISNNVLDCIDKYKTLHGVQGTIPVAEKNLQNFLKNIRHILSRVDLSGMSINYKVIEGKACVQIHGLEGVICKNIKELCDIYTLLFKGSGATMIGSSASDDGFVNFAGIKEIFRSMIDEVISLGLDVAAFFVTSEAVGVCVAYVTGFDEESQKSIGNLMKKEINLLIDYRGTPIKFGNMEELKNGNFFKELSILTKVCIIWQCLSIYASNCGVFCDFFKKNPNAQQKAIELIELPENLVAKGRFCSSVLEGLYILKVYCGFAWLNIPLLSPIVLGKMFYDSCAGELWALDLSGDNIFVEPSEDLTGIEKFLGGASRKMSYFGGIAASVLLKSISNLNFLMLCYSYYAYCPDETYYPTDGILSGPVINLSSLVAFIMSKEVVRDYLFAKMPDCSWDNAQDVVVVGGMNICNSGLELIGNFSECISDFSKDFFALFDGNKSPSSQEREMIVNKPPSSRKGNVILSRFGLLKFAMYSIMGSLDLYNAATHELPVGAAPLMYCPAAQDTFTCTAVPAWCTVAGGSGESCDVQQQTCVESCYASMLGRETMSMPWNGTMSGSDLEEYFVPFPKPAWA